MIYRLQGCKKSAVIGWMAGMLLLTGCTQDKLADASQGEILPEGKYPVTFIATGLGTTATTRATADDKWDGNEAVAVKIGNDVKNYVANGGGASITLKAAEDVTPFYWKSTDETKNVSAWYCGDGSTAADKENATAVPQTWSVQPDQNSSNGYQQSDFLYAPQTGIDFQGTKSLIFYHQTAKVVVNIRKQGVANDKDKITSVTINAVTEGDFTTTLTNNCGLSAKPGVNPSEIKSFRLTNPNKSVVFKDGESAEDALASFQALVIPQTLGSNTPIEIKIDGYDTFKYTPTETLAGGTQYTYNLTIDGKEVKATVTSTPMNWDGKESSSGTGGITSKTINLSEEKDVNIKREDVSYLITGSGTKPINISCNATVVFDGVTLNTGTSSSCINITSGSPKLIFYGKNTLNSQIAGVRLSNDAGVTIKGDGAQNTELNILGSFGIGVRAIWDKSFSTYNVSGSDIDISDIALNINCSIGGVGASAENSYATATCKNISLTNCKLDISIENSNIACIGASTNTNPRTLSKCDDIKLRDCEISKLVAGHAGSYFGPPAAIGCSSGNAACGNIDIYLRDGESVDDFLKNITVDGNADKVGIGSEMYYKPSIGTVTWYDHAEKNVGSGTKK